jgi:fumarate hydratase subunit beta
MTIKKITTPLTEVVIKSLQAGDRVCISGVVYAARDMAHQRLTDLLIKGKEFPMDLKGQIIYYVGPTPPPKGKVIGSAGPTTSGRMDSFTPALLEMGLKGMIGKGMRNREVVEAIKENGAVYFAAIGGAGALIASCIIESEVVAFEDLGTEAIRRLKVKDLPVIVAIDNEGNNLYEKGPSKYLENTGKEQC